MELADDRDLRMKPPKATNGAVAAKTTTDDPRLPMVGTVLTRQYKGQTVQVAVLREGFEYEGETFASLSAVAKAITGSHTSGFLFFRLNGKGGAK